MPTSPPLEHARRRTISSAKDVSELQRFVLALEQSNKEADILGRLQWLSLIYRSLSSSAEVKEEFRNMKGFTTLMDTLTSIAGFYDNERSKEEERHMGELIKSLFGVISEALTNHPGNRQYFVRHIGFDSIQQGLAATGMPIAARDELFGLLFGFAMDDATLSTLFTALRVGLREDVDEAASSVRERVGSMFGTKDILQNPEVIPIILEFQFALPRDPGEIDIVSMAITQALLSIAQGSKANMVAIHNTNVLSAYLMRLWDEDIPKQERAIMRDLATCLMRLGVNALEDAEFLYKKSLSNDDVAEFLLQAIRSSRGPAHIQFDTSLHGFSALEMSSTGRPFPPMASNGYTVSAWIYIDKYDVSMHTTLFGIFDKTQKTFLMAYIERDTRRFILQSSLSSANASVRFRSKVFSERKWYHIAIVHRRGKIAFSSKAALFVNGEFVEEVKCNYPQQPPPGQQTQLFIGIPIALSAKVGKNMIHTKWSLASMHIFEDILSDDLIAVFYRLGPRYYGNFQDSLGAFQTFEASAALHMRNELMHPGREEKSDIVTVIRNKASCLLPETKLLLSISPAAVLDDELVNSPEKGGFLKGLTKQASKNLLSFTRASPIVLNTAVPSIEEALCYPHGVAVLTGNPVIVKPQSLDEAAWRIGGCVAVCLKIVSAAKTPAQVCRAVRLLFESIKESWRNSEAMERENGFGILAHLLRQKEDPGVIGQELLKIILEFVGYNFTHPEESFIINPLAFRILLVDFDLWRNADLETLKQYFAQFVAFGKGSKYHHFNSKKLLKMRVVKKWLFALKSEMFTMEVLPYFMEAFKVVVTVNVGAEVLRSLALSITYSLHKENPAKSLKYKQSVASLRRQTNPVSGTNTPPKNIYTHGNNSVGSLAIKKSGLLVLQIYTELLCDPTNTTNIKKFAKTVTNKWLLYLLAENDPKVVALAAKILARLLVLHGPSYVQKFSAPPTGGFIIIRHRLKKWWSIPELWPICLAILFGLDVAKMDLTKPLSAMEQMCNGKLSVVYPEMLPVLTTMLKTGVTFLACEAGEEGVLVGGELGVKQTAIIRARSKSLSTLSHLPEDKAPEEYLAEMSDLLKGVIQFFSTANTRCPSVREFFVSQKFSKEIFSCLFPVVCTSDSVSAETELNSKDSALTFDGGDVVIRPLTAASHTRLPIVRTRVVDEPPSHGTENRGTKQKTLRRGSSFILITSEPPVYQPSSARLEPGILSPPSFKTEFSQSLSTHNGVVEKLSDLIVDIFVDMVLERREFNGFQFFSLVPPGFQEHQAYFDSYVLKHILDKVNKAIVAKLTMLTEPKVLTNIGRFTAHMTDYIYDGLFLNGADPLMDFIGTVLEYLQRPDVSKLKSVRLCNAVVGNLRLALSRLLIFRLSELDEKGTETKQIITFLNKLMYWQAVILSPENNDADFMKLICYLLYTKLMDVRHEVRVAATNIFRIVLVQKPEETAVLLNQADDGKDGDLSSGFQSLMEMDNETFIEWADDNKENLDAFFYGALSKTWELFVQEENRKTEERAKTRMAKRRDTLREWIMEDVNSEDVYGRHVSATNHWMANIYAEQHLRHQRALQDKQDSTSYVVSMFQKLEDELKRPGGLFDSGKTTGWKLDMTEGRNRMRKRLLPDASHHLHNYQPKRRGIPGVNMSSKTPPPKHALSVDDDEISIVSGRDAQPTPEPGNTNRDGADDDLDDFEIVEDPRGEEEDRYEDKNRKVLRSLQHGDAVDDVHNVSRLVGLKACEGLLILGRNHLYLIDNFFQRSDGEIVNVWQAPQEERDQYLQLIAGKDAEEKAEGEHESRHWAWEDLISISKRQFLFRDVGLELFFADGRSYLLTTISMKARNALHAKLISKATSLSNNQVSHTEEAWRIEALRSPDTATFGFGSKIASVFMSGAQNPATKRWMKGEISNFHYLMLVNTMAGRTFNDLTQYPVFPWVLADYTSEELDLTDPRTFRDFSKPMGAQTIERQREFRERYRSFEELGDKQSPPFHYGTHYSSAMIVCSYLIRLQPFVQSYLLLQGGQFDHADRLFYSIEKAWNSASKDNMTDVRELIPEFFFLSEFLVNSNSYNFGFKQGTGEAIDSVVLPPWAKGDPKIFIQKHREALECPYVSAHLHEWIDLVFGYKQRGEAAIEATNVFHHLSYRGAIDLDSIEDEVERLATIGIIHNFGQTPHQVFVRPHPPKEDLSKKSLRLDRAAAALIRLPFPVIESKETIGELHLSPKVEKVIPSSPTKLHIPPSYDKYIDWGFLDGSIRIYQADTRKQIAIFEHPHSGPLSTAIFLNSTTLITAGLDCVVSVWRLSLNRSPDLHFRASLFGHTNPVTVMALSQSFSTLVTCSPDHSVFVWDLNRLQFVRKLRVWEPVSCASVNDVSGDILLCMGQYVCLYTLNGELVVKQRVADGDDAVVSCKWYEGVGNEWLEKELLFTGHRRGMVKVWSKEVEGTKFMLKLVKTLHHGNGYQNDVNTAAITAILPLANAVHTGDENGRVYEWDTQTVERK